MTAAPEIAPADVAQLLAWASARGLSLTAAEIGTTADKLALACAKRLIDQRPPIVRNWRCASCGTHFPYGLHRLLCPRCLP